jgi:hypothetical protein
MSDERQKTSNSVPEPEKGQSPPGTEWSGTDMTTNLRPEVNIVINSEEETEKLQQ